LSTADPRAAGGLRLRLFVDPELADIAALPWELLYHPQRRELLSLNPSIAISRWLPTDHWVTVRPVRLPLKVIVVAPAPKGSASLDLARERDFILEGLRSYPAVDVCEVQPPTLERLVEVLENDPGIHILHYMGHGTFDAVAGEGALLFESPNGEAHRVSGEIIAAQLTACPALQLVVLNCCKSGRLPQRRGPDAFNSVATALLLAGLPAVIAMQRAIADQAALTFAGKLYSRLAKEDPVDVATTRGRLALLSQAPRALEWISPVVYLQVADGRILVPEEIPQQPFVAPPGLTVPPWIASLADRMSAEGSGTTYLNRSVRRTENRLQRLDRLFTLGTTLRREEAEVLWGAACLRLLAAGDDRPTALLEELAFPPELALAAVRAATAAEPGTNLDDPDLRTGFFRLDLIAALLRLSEILDLDRQAISPLLAGSMPGAGADIADWLAYLTREVRIERGGIVQFVLDAPTNEWIGPLKRCTSFRLEKVWQDLRGLLLRERLSVAVASSEVILGAVAKPPAAVLDRLRSLGMEIGIPQVVENHLGPFPPGLLPAILPLPDSTVDGEEVLALDAPQPGLLEIQEEGSDHLLCSRPIAWDEAEVVLDIADLRPDRWYRWWFSVRGAAGDTVLRRLGRLRPLPLRQKSPAQPALPTDPGYQKELIRLGLHTRLLRELIPLLESGVATEEDAALAYRLVSDAYDWVLRETPDGRLLDAYRKAALWIAPLRGDTP
jgi:hypothetical protein